MRKCLLFSINQSNYVLIWKYQKILSDIINKNRLFINNNQFDCLITTKHQNIYTIGKGGNINNIFFDKLSNDSRVVRVERGGDITWHGPGQLVYYPIFDLLSYKKDLHWYIRKLESVVISSLNKYSIHSHTSTINSGVWVDNNKISAVGISASRWITIHGISLNVNCDLTNFNNIIPCGITNQDTGVCSIQSVLKNNETIPTINDVNDNIINEFIQSFELDIVTNNTMKISLLNQVYPDINFNTNKTTIPSDEDILNQLLDHLPDYNNLTLEYIK